MGKRGKGRENGASSSSGFHTSLTLREEASGKKQSHNSKAVLKHKHLQSLAQWAAGLGQGKGKDEPSVGYLGALFGRRFAECETILQPGSNCTIRIEKNRAKRQRRSKTKTPTQNNVVYTCHFCLHRNLKRGTPKGHMKDLTPSKPISSKPKSVISAKKSKTNISNVKIGKEEISKVITAKANEENLNKVITAKANEEKLNKDITDKGDKENFSKVITDEATEAPAPAISNVCSSLTDAPTSSLAESGAKLLDSKRRKRKKPGLKRSTEETMVSSAPAEIEKGSGALKKRKKSWTTLKDIAESEKHDRNQRKRRHSDGTKGRDFMEFKKLAEEIAGPKEEGNTERRGDWQKGRVQASAGKSTRKGQVQASAGKIPRKGEEQAGEGRSSGKGEVQASEGRSSENGQKQASEGIKIFGALVLPKWTLSPEPKFQNG
uniref:Uncharacterized protein n=1 Tax=Chenopodium quinoa TaxID=63459 RepID=A0A803LU55_CHEQI